MLRIPCYLFSLLWLGTLSAQDGRPPNIVFVLADDLGYADLGCYGQELIATPNIDRLAADGMRFTQHYAGSTVCAPSRSVLMTGLHTGHTPIRGNGIYALADSTVTVAEVLKEQGYVTALIGKWGLGHEGTTGEPSQQGFDHYYGYLDQVYAHNYYPEYLLRNGQREYLDNTVEYQDSSLWHGGRGSTSSERRTYSHDLFTREALDFIANHADTSFYLYLPYTIPHDNGEQPLAERYEIPDYGDYADRDWTTTEKGYAAMISRLDRDVGRIRDRLDSLGLTENTLIVFTSDNGPVVSNYVDLSRFDSNGVLRGGKRDLYEGGIRVPLLAVLPGVVPAGTISDHPSSFQDWLPTLADLAGATDRPPTDGISMLPTLSGYRQQPQHDYLYWEFHEQGGKLAIRQGPWKGVRTEVFARPDGPLELYRLDSDPGETINIAAEHPEKVAELNRLLRASRVPSAQFPFVDRSR